MKKLILSIIVIVTIILSVHIWLDKTSFYGWMATYAIIYIGLFSILVSIWKEVIEDENNLYIVNKDNCIEIQDHYHWIGRISSILAFLIFCAIMAILTYNELIDHDATSSDIRRKSAMLYVLLTMSILDLYFYAIAFYVRNHNFNRNIFLCDKYITMQYPHKKLFKDKKIKSIRIEISEIEKIVWSPIDRTLDEEKVSIAGEFLNQIVLFPFSLLLIIIKFIYYIVCGFSLEYFFKNILIITKDEELLIQIKSKDEYETLKKYFNQFDIDIENLDFTIVANYYYVKD